MFAHIDNVEPKIFGIGLSRTGTTSLNEALRILGFRTYHWRAPIHPRLMRLEDFYLCDGATDINAAFTFETLHYIFSNAKFIYTARPMKGWRESISNHYKCVNPAQLRRRLLMTPVSTSEDPSIPEHNTALFQAVHHALYTGHDSWDAAYAAHEDRIMKFFADKPQKLLVLNIFEGNDGWVDLCRFLGRPVPSAPYPHKSWSAPPDISAAESAT